LVLIEAMAHGLPVVATYEGAIPDIIEDGVTGFLVPTRNVGALADRIALLLGDEGLRKAMGKRARRRYEERHQLDRFERELVRILAARLKDGPTWLNGRGGDAAP
jgi:glycosyltransferase involved in cell wall biosynthesis